MAFLRSLPGIDIMPPTKIQQLSLPELTINYNFKEVPRYDRCTTCHQGIDRIGYDKDAHGEEMTEVFRSHPFLTTGATTVDPRGKVVPAGLYLDANGPHPINSFGCTICHGGQGSGTDFTLCLAHAQHSRAGRGMAQKSTHWHEIHHWDFPMLPKRFIESSCLKCHTQVTDIPQAKKLQAGYQRIVKYGCTGCHTIGGEGAYGPDLTDERQVGPNLTHIASKDSKDWVLEVDHQSPCVPARFADAAVLRLDQQQRRGRLAQELRRDPRDHPLPVRQEHAGQPSSSIRPPRPTRPRGKSCSCRRAAWPAISTGPIKQTRPPARRIEKIGQLRAYKSPTRVADLRSQGISRRRSQEYAQADFGPNLSNMAAKFQSQARRAEVAVQLDRRAREIPSQEPDAQPPALAARRRRYRELDSFGARRMAGQGGGARRRLQGSQGGRRRAGQALCLQERQLQEGRRQVDGRVARAKSTSWSTRS